MFAAFVQALPDVLSGALRMFLFYGFWRGLTLRRMSASIAHLRSVDISGND